MTNNHVLENADSAEISFIEFDYEEHKQAIKVKLKPTELFITSQELDFTIVACETAGIEQIKPITLLRNPTDYFGRNKKNRVTVVVKLQPGSRN